MFWPVCKGVVTITWMVFVLDGIHVTGVAIFKINLITVVLWLCQCYVLNMMILRCYVVYCVIIMQPVL